MMTVFSGALGDPGSRQSATAMTGIGEFPCSLRSWGLYFFQWPIFLQSGHGVLDVGWDLFPEYSLLQCLGLPQLKQAPFLGGGLGVLLE